MSIKERLKALISSAPTVEQLRAGIADLEAELQSAEAAAKEEADRHTAQALELLSRGDDAIKRSRARVDDAQANVADVQRALSAARIQLGLAESERAIDDLAMRWDLSRRLLKQRVEKASELQGLLDQVAARYGELLELTERAYQSLPAKPDGRPVMMTQFGIGLAVETYLFGATDGRLSSPGGASSAHMARQRPDLASVADDMCVLLMAKAIDSAKEV
ncbi:hypothetical protein [Paraburkholderia caribensis]|uniref:Uncharacterized protein n=1 Tax=Paraburkholderia caribensis TaxID=75105 RepID=A0A9Q6WM25_9BURK|nr:hypothetical protein [Paraburkholderia caribensis]QLB63468.1 hypothetical protein A9O66_14405 [Paraburkholderia caribensis]